MTSEQRLYAANTLARLYADRWNPDEAEPQYTVAELLNMSDQELENLMAWEQITYPMPFDERQKLTYSLAESIYEGMSMDDVHEFVIEHMVQAYQEYTDEEFMTEVEEYAPHLLEEDDDA